MKQYKLTSDCIRSSFRRLQARSDVIVARTDRAMAQLVHGGRDVTRVRRVRRHPGRRRRQAPSLEAQESHSAYRAESCDGRARIACVHPQDTAAVGRDVSPSQHAWTEVPELTSLAATVREAGVCSPQLVVRIRRLRADECASKSSQGRLNSARSRQ